MLVTLLPPSLLLPLRLSVARLSCVRSLGPSQTSRQEVSRCPSGTCQSYCGRPCLSPTSTAQRVCVACERVMTEHCWSPTSTAQRVCVACERVMTVNIAGHLQVRHNAFVWRVNVL